MSVLYGIYEHQMYIRTLIGNEIDKLVSLTCNFPHLQVCDFEINLKSASTHL